MPSGGVCLTGCGCLSRSCIVSKRLNVRPQLLWNANRKLYRSFSNGTIFHGTKRRAVSLRQLSILYSIDKIRRHEYMTVTCSSKWPFSANIRDLYDKHIHRVRDRQYTFGITLTTQNIYTVSQKTVHFCFCQNFVKFSPTLISFGM